MKVFKSGEEEYEHMLLDLKALGLGHQQLQAEEDHVLFSPGEETEAHKAKKRKKRKHHYGGERVALKDGTRYYGAEG